MSLFDLQKKIYAAINVSSIKTIAKIYDYIPEKAKMPFVLLGDDSAIEHKTKTFLGYEVTSIIYVWGEERSMKNVKTLLDRLGGLLGKDLDEYKFHAISAISARRESVEYVKGMIEVKYRITEV